MALAQTTVARLQPAIALNIALGEFEAILTDEQKGRFTASLAPDANAAVKLAIEIDQDNVNRRGRCLGTRLVKFLESVQQFSDIVGTFVSSSPQIAALVWGGVKLSLLIVNNFTSYFDKLSNVFMQIGRTCPRFAELGTLYITSTRLQGVLCEYYAVVVKLCKSAVEFSRKSGIVQRSLYSFRESVKADQLISIFTSHISVLETIRSGIRAPAETTIRIIERNTRGNLTRFNASAKEGVQSPKLGAKTRQRIPHLYQRVSE